MSNVDFPDMYQFPVGKEWTHRKAHVRVLVNGDDVTLKIDPYLISVVVVDKKDYEVDTCSLELDDRDARLEMPVIGDPVEVYMGWDSEAGALVFQGYISDIESGFSRRGGGRRMWIEAEGIEILGASKTIDRANLGVGDPPDQDQASTAGSIPLSTWMGQVGALAGFPVVVAGELASVARKYWNMAGESPMHHIQRIAREVGGSAKFTTAGAVITSALMNLGSNVVAQWSVNLIAWRIKPTVARPQYAGAGNDWFHIIRGAWESVRNTIEQGLPFGRSIAQAWLPNPAPNPQVGEQGNASSASDSIRGRGLGWVMINGDATARAGGTVTIVGARPGVDGTYGIAEAEHHYSRASGFVTRLNVEDPPSQGSERPSGQWPRSGGGGEGALPEGATTEV